MTTPSVNEWATDAHASAYLSRPDQYRRVEGEATLWELVPQRAARVLDLGTGDGRLLARLRERCPFDEGVALDFSPTMLRAARARFDGDPAVHVVEHDLDRPLPDVGRFDVVVSSFAIHHLDDDRKQSLYREVFARLRPGGLFANLEHVSSPTQALHEVFYSMIEAGEDPSNKLAPVDVQLEWLRDAGFADVDCFWKWRELALLAGTRPAEQRQSILN
jgi:SAM-dependent methyltransferase